MNYTIKVKRGEHKGRLTFSHGNVSVDTTCWWDPSNKVDAGTYNGSATWMDSKKEDGGIACPWKGGQKYRPGIFLGRGVPTKNGTDSSNEIFIHKGTKPEHSDGCIVCASSEVLKIWNVITPKDTACVTVIVEDETVLPDYSPITGPGFGWGCVYNPYHYPNNGFGPQYY